MIGGCQAVAMVVLAMSVRAHLQPLTLSCRSGAADVA
jgi:hypothetical protein